MRAMHPPGTGRPKVLPWMVHLATNTNFIAKIKLNESEPMIRFFWPWFGPCFITRHEKPWLKPYHRPLLHEDTNNGQYSEISILVTVLQLSGHPVAKCNLWNDRATQILPNTGPTGNPRIPFAKVHVVPDDAAMLDVWLSNYAYFFQYFYVGPPKICVEHPTYTINWVVLWVTQDSSLAAALILVILTDFMVSADPWLMDDPELMQTTKQQPWVVRWTTQDFGIVCSTELGIHKLERVSIPLCKICKNYLLLYCKYYLTYNKSL